MGVKIKEAALIDELTDSCLFPISDGSDKPRVANFVKVKEFLGDTKQAEKDINDLQRKINYLTRDGLDSGMSVREISEEVLSPTATNVETLIGTDRDKSVRTIATEVLAGASTGGGIDLDLYLSKSEAENTYEKKGVGYTKGEIDNKINEAVRINGEELSKKADKTTVESLSASVDVNKDIIKNIIVPQVDANTEAIKDKASQETVDGISESVGALSIRVDKKAESSAVQALVSQISQKVEKTTYNTKVTELEGAIESKYTKPAGGIPVKDLVGEVATETEVLNAISVATEAIDIKIGNKVDKETYNTKVAELVSDIEDKISKTDTIPAESIVPLSAGKSGIVGNTPIIANRIPYLKADAFAFLQPEDFSVEVAYDGITWETLDNNNADMRGMFAQMNYGTGFSIDGSNNENWKEGSKIRITLSPKAARNAKVDFVALNVYANGRTFDILTEYYDSSLGKEGWYSVGDPITISSNGIAFVKYDQYFSFKGYARGGARFTFTITRNTQYGSRIVGLSGYGNLASEIIPTSSTAPYTLGTLWYWDYLKNVYFPNNIYEGGKSLGEKYAGKSDVGALASVVQEKAYTSYVNDFFVRKEEAIDFAKDLTGVLEATPEEFTFRPSAGDKSIRDESAVIRRIKGNTTVWRQYVKNGDFAEGTRYFTTINSTLSDNGDGSITVINELDNSCGLSTTFDTIIPRDHKILAIVDYQRDSASTSSSYFYLRRNGGNFDSYITSTFADAQRRVDYAIITSTDDIVGFFFYPFFYSPVGTQSIIYTMAVYDLTAIYGAGNEPSTLEAFKGSYPDNYYPYCEPEIRNVKTTAIETIGFNQWDEEWESGSFNTATGENISTKQIRCKNLIRVLPNTYYSLSIGNTNMGIWAMFYDENNNILAPVIINDTSPIVGKCLYISPSNSRNIFVTPTDAVWMKFYLPTEYGSSYNNDICINLSHSGVRNGEYHPYKESILNLPEVLNYFSKGMNSVGDVYDEINSENAIQRIGVVDIGTLEWYAGSQKNMFLAPIENAKPTVWNEITNAIMLPYTAVSRIESGTADMSFCVNNMAHYPNRVCLTNFNYEDAASFKAAMSGVYLYYELEKPEIRPILDPIQLSYDVEDFGTERIISRDGSSPFRADIVYQFNAEGRIRDNDRNIAKLETKVNTLDRVASVVSGRFDGGYVKAEGIIDSLENFYLLPSSSSTEKNKRLANEQYVIDSLPREVAQVLERKVGTIPQNLSPNILYESAASVTNLTIASFNGQDDNYEDVWRIRCGLGSGVTIKIIPTILWENGIAPNPTEWGLYEFEFRKTPDVDNNRILGRWRVYK